jgi:hypothetical protein
MGAQIVTQTSARFWTLKQRSSTMANSENIRMTLTAEQKEQIRKATGKDAETLEFSVEELEERIAPMTRKGWRSANPL